MPNKPKLIYLDHAAATPVDDTVLVAMKPYFKDSFFNPSATYAPALISKQALEQARSDVALVLGAKASEITFTAGGSEANNLAIHGLMRQYPGAKLVVSAVEHESILRPADQYDTKLCPVDKGGLVDLEALAKLIDDQTVLVSVMYVSNEIGTIQPLSAIARIIAEIKAGRQERGIVLPLYFHSDACQAANYLDLHISRLGVDLMTLNGGKIYGPKQTGALYLKAGIKIKPLIYGGGQEHGLRSGTENVAGAVGMAKALVSAQKIRKTEVKRLEGLRDYFVKELLKYRPDVVINGSTKSKIANNIHFSVPGVDNERLLIKLDQAGILAAAGSACSASSEEPSHVLKAIGLDDKTAQSSIRMTTGRSTDMADIKQTIKVIKTLI